MPSWGQNWAPLLQTPRTSPRGPPLLATAQPTALLRFVNAVPKCGLSPNAGRPGLQRGDLLTCPLLTYLQALITRESGKCIDDVQPCDERLQFIARNPPALPAEHTNLYNSLLWILSPVRLARPNKLENPGVNPCPLTIPPVVLVVTSKHLAVPPLIPKSLLNKFTCVTNLHVMVPLICFCRVVAYGRQLVVLPRLPTRKLTTLFPGACFIPHLLTAIGVAKKGILLNVDTRPQQVQVSSMCVLVQHRSVVLSTFVMVLPVLQTIEPVWVVTRHLLA